MSRPWPPISVRELSVLGEWRGAGPMRPTVLVYGHYDVQPVDPLNLWSTPPFEPRIDTLPDGRKIIVGRGACDDKGQFMTFVEALRAFKAVTGKLPLDITMMIEGEEEMGSRNLFEFVRANASEFKRDLGLVCDTGMWSSTIPSVTTSLRGLVYEEVTVTCADRDLHSGVFGGGAANPIRVLSRVIAGLHDDSGRITLPGFYDGVKELPADIKADLTALNMTPEGFLGQVGLKIPAGEKDRMLIEQVSTRPTCDVNGIIGGYTGEGAKTVIAAQASAKISFRLVGDQDPKKIRAAFRKYVQECLPADAKVTFGEFGGSPALSVAYDNPALGNPTSFVGHCTSCHDTPDVGNHSLPLPLDIGTGHTPLPNLESDAAIAAGVAQLGMPNLPVFLINGCPNPFNHGQPASFYTTDPGKALVTGLCSDFNRVKGPVLRGLAARAPYFHNGAAESLREVVNFYNERFKMELTAKQKNELIAFLNSL